MQSSEQTIEIVECGPLPLYDVNYTGVEDKFVNLILHAHQFSTSLNTDKAESEIYNAWCRQSDFDFGFVPLSE